jgi:hypothetical protein
MSALFGFRQPLRVGLARGFSSATFYKWRAKFGGMEASDIFSGRANSPTVSSLRASPALLLTSSSMRKGAKNGVQFAPFIRRISFGFVRRRNDLCHGYAFAEWALSMG